MPGRKKRLGNWIRYCLLFLPLKRNGLLFFILALLTIYLLRGEFYTEGSQFVPYLQLFAWMLGTFSVFVVGVGFFYTFTCWVFLLAIRKKVTIDLKIGLEDGKKGAVGKVPVHIQISKVLMPLMGYLKVWVIFEDQTLSGPVILNDFARGWKDLMPKSGTSNLLLSDRKQYAIQGYVLAFEDYLQFWRLSWYQKAKEHFYMYPLKSEIKVPDIPPSKSKEEKERVKTSKRVEGDFLNYKDFESGDDVRRIVWKIFAKNRELVVRIPEITNPYASHIQLYCSFFKDPSINWNDKRINGMLNYYKDMIYNTCLSFEKTGRKIKFEIDQVSTQEIAVARKDELIYALSCASWNIDRPVSDLSAVAASDVICVSSLVPAAQIEEVISRHSASLFVIKVSKYLDHQNWFDWKNLFLRRSQKSEFSKLSWMLSAQRRKIRKNENAISELMSQSTLQGQLI